MSKNIFDFTERSGLVEELNDKDKWPPSIDPKRFLLRNCVGIE